MKIKKRDVILILVILALAGGLLIFAKAQRSAASTPAASAASAEPAPSDEPTSNEARAQAEAYLEAHPAESYLYVEAAAGALMVPLTEERTIPIDQGNGAVNNIHIGVNSAYMESSTCDNQNCVDQGEITLENRETRVLYNMIICIPHDLLLELMTPEEALEQLEALYQAQLETAAAYAS